MRAQTTVLGIGLMLSTVPMLHAGSIGGVVFEDANRSGEQEAGELGLENAPVSLLGAEGAVRETMRTEADGSFRFDGLPDGDYLLSLPDANRFRASLPNDVALPAPIPDFPVGSPRYSAPAHLVDNLELADALGLPFRHVGLGDSIGFGFNLCGSILGENGYFEPTTGRVRRAAPGDVIEDKQAVPGDETADLLDPDIDLLVLANDVFYAVDEQAALISISIGGNDFLGPNERGDAEIAAALVTARQNIQEILSSLVGELPWADVEFNTVYDNLEGDEPVHNTWVPIWMQVLREHAWAQSERVTVAEIYPEYAHDEGGLRLGEPDLICHFFGLDEIHPTNRGYDVHEEKLWQSFGGVTLTGGSDQLDISLGILSKRGETEAASVAVIAGGVDSAELALAVDGKGALVDSDGAEIRVSDFLPSEPPDGLELAQAVVRVTYRTTGAPIDDYYRFEASIDGSFSPPGDTPTTWNTILPIVGSAGNDGAEILAFPDQPTFRTVSAPLYLGAPTDNATATLTFDDLHTLTVRLVTTAVGAPDPFEVEWDGARVEVYTRPSDSTARSATRPPAPPATSTPLVPLRPEELRIVLDTVLNTVLDTALERGTGAERRGAVREVRRRPSVLTPDEWRRLLQDPDPRVRILAYDALGTAHDVAQSELSRVDAETDPRVLLAAGESFLKRGHPRGTELLVGRAAAWPPSRDATRLLRSSRADLATLYVELSSADSERRRAAALALAAVDGTADGARSDLAGMLDASDPRESWAARVALASIADRRALDDLEPLSPRHRLELLRHFDDPSSLVALQRLAADRSGPATVRARAARALAKRPADARHLLESLVDCDDVRVSRIARSGLTGAH